MFEEFVKRDADFALSNLMQEARHKAWENKNRILADALNVSADRSKRFFVSVVAEEADKAHNAATREAKNIFLNYIERMNLPIGEGLDWAARELESLSNILLSLVVQQGISNEEEDILNECVERFIWRGREVLAEISTAYRSLAGTSVPPTSSRNGKSGGGRPKAQWSDDLWVEMCRQLYVGDLKPRKQADITKAMTEWLSVRGEEPSDSTIKDRARKLWAVIEKDAN